MDCRLRLREMFNSLAPPEIMKSVRGGLWPRKEAKRSYSGMQDIEDPGVEMIRPDVRLSLEAVRDIQWWMRKHATHMWAVKYGRSQMRVFSRLRVCKDGVRHGNERYHIGFLFGEGRGGPHQRTRVSCRTTRTSFLYSIRPKQACAAGHRLDCYIAHRQQLQEPVATSTGKVALVAEFREQNEITLSNHHLQLVLNCWAERIYRQKDTPDWKLPFEAPKIIEKRFTKPAFFLGWHDLP